jgi:cellobiose-specific phosphotransferase system component IIB
MMSTTGFLAITRAVYRSTGRASSDSWLHFRGNPLRLGGVNDDLLPELLRAVEQQLVSPQTKYVAKTLERLVKEGVPEAEAKEQIALCLGQEMDASFRKRRGFDEKAYRELLDELPVEAGDEEE